jgi:mRNA-degrading endonuclease toxin of MazEF toxin-antitoxin module
MKQLRAVDTSRMTNQQGILEKRYLDPIKAALEIMFDL